MTTSDIILIICVGLINFWIGYNSGKSSGRADARYAYYVRERRRRLSRIKGRKG